MFALVDANNFYVSCERVFHPRLEGRAVVVLSNNDGCAISRSDEAKALGVRMGQPMHELRDLERRGDLVALSANFELYGDLSHRLMTVLGDMAPGQEIYSIDETFLDVSGLADRPALGLAMQQRAQRWTGLPVCIGFGPTKTLAKLANHIAKSAARKPGSYPAKLAGVCDMAAQSPRQQAILLDATPVAEVWGVGRRLAPQMEALGLRTALDLARADAGVLRKRFSIVLVRTARELAGEPCLPLEDAPPPTQQVMFSRSFGQAVTDKAVMAEALMAFTASAATRLRAQGLFCSAVHVMMRTSPFRPNDAQYRAALTVPLDPTDSSPRLAGAALAALDALWRPGFDYRKAGVMLLDLRPAQAPAQADLFAPPPQPPSAAMAAIDAINRRFGRDTVTLGRTTTGEVRDWQMKQARRSPRYTTRLDELRVVGGDAEQSATVNKGLAQAFRP
ncbi:Y-family DNA polymerase [Amphibiibacter pelophylacis]|uniref:Y-family DNA polymerase n=1 Tax=Amphibiibacter pelophylacis TaxID=1799477 RepID=A0ACC6P176_9BURK